MSRLRRRQGRLREVHLKERANRQSAARPLPRPCGAGERAAAVLEAVRQAGFPRSGFVDPDLLAPWSSRMAQLRRRCSTGAWGGDGLELDWILHPDRWSRTRSILVSCLSTYRSEPADLSLPDDPHALIAPFARRNLYGLAAVMMRRALSAIEEQHGIPARDSRVFVNSRIPEKPLLVAAGLAAYGANSLAIAPGLGTELVIAGAVLPVPSEEVRQHFLGPRPDPCGSCRRCVRACPVGAIVEPGVVDAGRCLQGLAASAVPFSEDAREAWGVRLYGCQACQEVCPHNAQHAEVAPPAPGELGPSLSISTLLRSGISGVKRLFHKTPMGLSWVSPHALLRNALVAAAHRRHPGLRADVESFLGSGIPLLEETARWSLSRIPAR